jgi:hypothetical protein
MTFDELNETENGFMCEAIELMQVLRREKDEISAMKGDHKFDHDLDYVLYRLEQLSRLTAALRSLETVQQEGAAKLRAALKKFIPLVASGLELEVLEQHAATEYKQAARRRMEASYAS